MTDTQPLADRVAIVTGASSGIGRATAKTLAADGAAVVLAARRESVLDELATEIENAHGTQTLAVPTDVTDAEAVETLVESTIETFGRLDVLVNNAGILRMADRLEDLSLSDYHDQMATNVDGTFYATRAALPHLRESKGLVIFVGSDSGKHPDPLLLTYASSKWWVRGFAKSLDAREGPNGVGVTLVNPGDTLTDINFRGAPLSEQAEEGNLLDAQEIADAVAFAARQRPTSTISEIDVSHRELGGEIYGALVEE
jgi:NADP-dependent 3-hydroxy acid dehydrogenase YdfG